MRQQPHLGHLNAVNYDVTCERDIARAIFVELTVVGTETTEERRSFYSFLTAEFKSVGRIFG